jgi:photosystem II stability/assembly factor-like uncharacterized protein
VADLPPIVPAEPKAAKKMPAGDEPDKAAAFYLERRMGEGATELPLDRYRVARERAGRMPLISISQGRSSKPSSQRNANLGSWQALGPENQGGRTKSLLIDPRDPKVMYAGAVTGGVWKTTDGGENWLPLTDLFPTTGLGALAMDPSNPDVIYAGTGFWFNSQSGTNVLGSAPRGVGIFRSRDSGANWEPLVNPGGNHFRFINDIVVSRMDPNRIYAATWTGIFRSVDGGQSWTHVFDRGGGQNGCQDMVSRTDQTVDYLFASCGTTSAGDAAIFRNPDAGGAGNWTKVFQLRSMGNTTLAIAPSNQSIIYALMSNNGEEASGWRSSLLGVYRSTVNGDPDTWEARVTYLDETQVNTGILSTNSGFYSNQCGGSTRTISGQGWIHNAIAVDPQDPDRVYAGGIDIYRSDDGGRNWGIASFWQAADGPNGAHADLLGLHFPPDFDGESKPHLYAVTDGGVYLTRNARAAVARGERAGCTPFQNQVAWTPLHGGYQTTQFYSGAVLPGGAFFLGGKQDNGTLLGGLGRARSWQRLRGGDGAAVAVDPRDPNRMLVSTQNFGLVRTLNGGKTFLNGLTGITEPSANFAFIAPLAMDLNNPDRLYAGARTLWRTENQAGRWSQISSALRTELGYVSSVAVSPADSTKVVFGTHQGFVLRSPNALEAGPETVWEASRPRPGYLPGLTFDPVDANVVYAVYSQFNTAPGQSHIYRSTDGGATWDGIDGTGDTRIPDIPVFTLTIDPRDRNQLYAGTDIGVFVSYDGGRNWARDSNPFAAVPTEALILEREGGATYLYAFTFGRGVWRTMLPDTGTACEYDVDGLDQVPAFGGVRGVAIRTGEGCSWSALPQSTVLDVQSPATGKGTGTVNVSVPLNFSAAPRPLGLIVQGKLINSTQAGAAQVPAAADEYSSPAVIEALPYVGIRDTRATTRSDSDPKASCSTGDPQKTIWWRFTASESGTLEVGIQGQRYDVAGNSGVVMSTWLGSPAGLGQEIGCVEIPRNQGAWLTRGLRFTVTAGTTYYVLASATGGAPADGGYTVLSMRMVLD